MSNETPISPDVIEALRGGTITGNTFKLGRKITRELYRDVDNALKTIGGRWSKEEAAHTFEADPTQAIASIIEQGPTLPLVIVEIRNGVAKVLDHPKGLEVQIRYINL